MEAGCWLLGGEFEDSVFEERRERRPGPPASYRAKLCEPQWFYGETESSDDVEALTIKKFRGDLAYRRQEYQKALQEYSSISEKLPPTNVAMKRDVQEGRARCLAHLGRRAEALAIATDLEMKATNTDHLTTVLCLQLAICSSSQDATFCLQKLVSLHPFSPWTWGRLAEAYLAARPALSSSAASSHRQSHSTSRDKAVTSACPHSGEDCRLCFPETLPESSVCSVETSSSKSRKKEEALTNFRDSLSLEARMKACASFIRTRWSCGWLLVLSVLAWGDSEEPPLLSHRSRHCIHPALDSFSWHSSLPEIVLLFVISLLPSHEAEACLFCSPVSPRACSSEWCLHSQYFINTHEGPGGRVGQETRL
ncbi:uncharacterized protein C8orf76 homolog isoform X2 [Myotis myotis]|uniref:uncharacterized protein C8orf76 homolog isoform X2 n=1 Tax=Myotis myotis TaxID=51298 RepID=UPI00174AA5F5|nr:uncharacterized protein C8orf76 homolog isoform X2 [Myotis myotis]